MKTLQLDEEKAKKLYDTAAPEFKAMLEDTFGAKHFSKDIRDRVKSYDDALAIMRQQDPSGYMNELPNPFSCHEKDRDAIKTFAQLCVIVRALNEGWEPDWNDTDQPKYFVWFDMRNGFSFNGVVGNYFISGVGSRLCFRTRELAEYAGHQFLQLYKDLATL